MGPTNTETLTNEHLSRLVGDVLGNLAFMVSDDEPAELPPGAVWLQCSVRYDGPVSGELCCWCTRDFAIQLAANLLGIEPDEGDAQISAEDAFCEFLNVLCGQLVTAWHGSDAVFNLSIPSCRECLETPAPPSGSTGLYSQLSISGEPFYCTYDRA